MDKKYYVIAEMKDGTNKRIDFETKKKYDEFWNNLQEDINNYPDIEDIGEWSD